MDTNKLFEKQNRVTLSLSRKIGKALIGYEKASIPFLVNAMCINLKLTSAYRQLNSCCIITQRGGGKTSLLEYVLAENNPEMFYMLPQRMFESDLVVKGDDMSDGFSSKFHRKILIHSDLIVAFKGMKKSQLEHLTNFFTALFSDGYYCREDKSGKHEVRAKCMAFFGMATEAFHQYHRDLFDQTVTDRIAFFNKSLSDNEKREILNNDIPTLPSIKLPFYKKPKSVKLHITPDVRNRITENSMKLDKLKVLSFQRARKFIELFMMSNALLNNRSKTTEQDFLMFEHVSPLFFTSHEHLTDLEFLNRLMGDYPDANDAFLLKKTGWSHGKFYNVKKGWKDAYGGYKHG